MKIEVSCDLAQAYSQMTTLGRIFYLWMIGLAWIILLCMSIYLVYSVRFGIWAGFINESD